LAYGDMRVKKSPGARILMLENIGRLLAIAALLLGVPAPVAAARERAPRPALWLVADDDTRIWLFGTFHLLPPGKAWTSRRIDRAVAEADELVLELVDAGDHQAIAATMAELGYSPGLPPLSARVPADQRDELVGVVAESGAMPAILDRLETWAAALSLAGVMFTRLGISGDAGVEEGLTRRLAGSGKPIRGLETAEEQFRFFDGLSEPAQRSFLAGMLDDPRDMQGQFDAMMNAWLAGDVEGIARTFNDEQDLTPELKEVLIERRNANWALWVERRLAAPGTAFVAVGAGHLAGPGSLQEKLGARGLRVRRVQ